MTEQNNLDYFPQLRLHVLQALATSYANEYKVIQKITLHHYLSKERSNCKYALVFHFSKFDPKDPSWGDIIEERSNQPNDNPKEIKDECKFLDEFRYSFIFDLRTTFVKDDFYRTDESSQASISITDLRKEWYFHDRFSGEELPENILIHNACCLFPQESLERPMGDYVFLKKGGYWTISYEGELFRLKDSKGLRYIAILLENPEKAFHVGELIQGVEGTPSLNHGSTYKRMNKEQLEKEALKLSKKDDVSDDSVLDEKAIGEFKKRWMDLLEDKREAQDHNDQARLTIINSEIEAIESALTTARGLGGRHRKLYDQKEKNRKSVAYSINYSFNKIEKMNKIVHKHLKNSIKTGTFCCYKPEKPTSWTL